MKRAAEVGKPSVRCSAEEPGAGDVSLRAVSITKPEELVATDGIAKRSPKLTPAGGAMFSVGIKRPRKPAMFSVGSKRPRKPEKLSKKEKEKGERATKEKGEEETTEEEGKRHRHNKPNKLELEPYKVELGPLEERIMDRLALLDKMKKKKLLTENLSHSYIEKCLINEICEFMFCEPIDTLSQCNMSFMDGLTGDPYTDARITSSSKKDIETKVSILQQYRTNGYAVLQYEATDDEEEG